MIQIRRLPWDMFFMLQAHLVATRATCDRGPELLLDPGRHGVGCVIVKDQRLIASGYAGSPPGQPHCDEEGHIMVDDHCRRTIHSEMNAIMQCALDQTNPKGATLYTTASPCFDCAKALARVGVARVVSGAYYDSRYSLSTQSEDLLYSAGVKVERLPLRIYNGEIRNVIPTTPNYTSSIIEVRKSGMVCVRCGNELNMLEESVEGLTVVAPCETCYEDATGDRVGEGYARFMQKGVGA